MPGIIERHRGELDQVLSVDSPTAVAEMRRLASTHGIFVGPSSAHLVAARRLRSALGLEHVVTFFCDEGEVPPGLLRATDSRDALDIGATVD